MKLLICGSRDWDDYEAIVCRLSLFQGSLTVIHGAASRRVDGREVSADALADRAAEYLGFDRLAFPADWSSYGKRAGILRNLRMLDQEPDLVIAFQRNKSRGTQHTISEAQRRGIPVEVHER